MKKFCRGSRAMVFIVTTFTGMMILSSCADGQSEGGSEAADPQYSVGDTVSVAGTLVDTRCLATNWSNMGMDHPDPVPTGHTGEACARFCAREGFPVGLATGTKEGSRVWMLLSTPPLLSDYMAQTVRIRGVVRSEGILTPLRVEAKRPDGGWTFVI